MEKLYKIKDYSFGVQLSFFTRFAEKNSSELSQNIL